MKNTKQMELWNRFNKKLNESGNPEVWIKEFYSILEKVEHQAILNERKRVAGWLDKNQSLETKELGKIVLWGWIYEIVNNTKNAEESD